MRNLDKEMIRAKTLLEETFDGFITIGFPVDISEEHQPACILVGALTVPRLQRMVTLLRIQAKYLEDRLVFSDQIEQDEADMGEDFGDGYDDYEGEGIGL